MDSKLGLTANNNGNLILVPIPALTEERRKDLIKYVHQLIEDGRVSIRNIRRDILHELKTFGEIEHISEDEIHRQETKIQKLTDNYVSLLNTLQENKEKDLMDF
jgi:ribosome recycling factor